jgi:hypothetical protein
MPFLILNGRLKVLVALQLQILGFGYLRGRNDCGVLAEIA